MRLTNLGKRVLMPASATSSLLVLLSMSMDPAAQQQKQLSSLATGDPLSGRVIGRHRQKLFLDVPVVRPAAEGREAPVQAYLSLPAWHELLQQPADGTTLDVFVRKVQAASGRLEVDLRAKPRAPRPANPTRPLGSSD